MCASKAHLTVIGRTPDVIRCAKQSAFLEAGRLLRPAARETLNDTLLPLIGRSALCQRRPCAHNSFVICLKP